MHRTPLFLTLLAAVLWQVSKKRPPKIQRLELAA